MKPMFMNLTLAFIAGCCVTACGGSSDDHVLVDAPKDLTPAEKAEFQARKVDRSEIETPYVGEPDPYQITANGATLVSTAREGGKRIARKDYRSLQPGMTTLNGRYIFTNSGQSEPETIRSYQGFRSGVVIAYNPADGRADYGSMYGAGTPLASFPGAGHATYRGTAFDMKEEGALTYHVDFAAKNGHGEISGLSRHGTITLANAPFAEGYAEGYSNINGTASSAKGSSFDYVVGFYGQQAEEIAGYAQSAQFEAVGFHGTRGAISE